MYTGVPCSWVLAAFVAATSWGVVTLAQGQNAAEEIRFYLLSTNDLHEHGENLGKIRSFIESMRQRHPGAVIVLDAGDMMYYDRPTGKVDWREKGKDIYAWAGQIRYDAMTFGNHDFTAGVKHTQSLIAKYRLPFVCANIAHQDLDLGGVDSEKPVRCARTFARTVNGHTVRFAVIGLTDQEHKDFHVRDEQGRDKADDRGAPYKNELKVFPVNGAPVKKLAAQLKDSHILILLSHNWDAVDKEHVAGLPGATIVVGGHEHGTVTPGEKAKTFRQHWLLTKSGCYGKHVGLTTIVWDAKNHAVREIIASNQDMSNWRAAKLQVGSDSPPQPRAADSVGSVGAARPYFVAVATRSRGENGLVPANVRDAIGQRQQAMIGAIEAAGGAADGNTVQLKHGSMTFFDPTDCHVSLARSLSSDNLPKIKSVLEHLSKDKSYSIKPLVDGARLARQGDYLAYQFQRDDHAYDKLRGLATHIKTGLEKQGIASQDEGHFHISIAICRPAEGQTSSALQAEFLAALRDHPPRIDPSRLPCEGFGVEGVAVLESVHTRERRYKPLLYIMFQ